MNGVAGGRLRALATVVVVASAAVLSPTASPAGSTGQWHASGLARQGADSWTAWRSSPSDVRIRLASAGLTTLPASMLLDVSASASHQTWRGVGAALTDASVGLLRSNSDATSLLFDPARADGAHLNLVRLPLSATDFSTTEWAFGWNDATGSLAVPPEAQSSVSFLVGTLLPRRPDLRAVAVPWSAPAGMKDSGSLNGGALEGTAIGPYARMLVAQADWLKGHGVPLAAMTLGNEPFHSTPTYPSMLLSDAQMVALAAQASPALGQRDVELWAVDHNWELRDHYDAVLAGAPGAFAASAFHCYGGYPGQMGAVAAPPVVTECTGTNDGFDGTFRWDAKNLVVDAIDAGSTGLMMWNLALNENHGPHTGGCDTCRGVIDVNSQTVAVTRNPEFYTLAHLARAADPGAVVVGNSWTSGVPYVAFRNPDGSIGIFGHNDTGSTQVFGVALDGWASASRFEVGADELFTLRGQSGMVAGSVGLSDESPVVGRSLASTLAGWSPDPLHVDYQWLSDGSPIVGATGPTFTPRPSEVGAALSLQARGSRPGFTGATAVSVASVRVRPASLPAVLNVVRPRVSGTAQVGRTMTVTRGTWLPSSAAIAPQWFRDSSPIAGARGFSYAIRPADLGRRIWARAVATAPGRTRLDVVTPRSPRVRPGTFVVLARGRVRGAAHVGSRVWWEGTRSRPAASISFQWAADGAVIASAASRRPSYVLRQADRGHIMSVRLTLRAAGYLSMSVVVRQPGRVA